MSENHAGTPVHVSGQSNKPLSRPAHALPWPDVVRELGGNADGGLSATDAGARLQEFGRNELDDGPGVQRIQIFIRQVANAMTLVRFSHVPCSQPLTVSQVLIMAMAVSFGIKSWIEGGVIAAVVVLNIVVGYFQVRYRASSISLPCKSTGSLYLTLPLFA